MTNKVMSDKNMKIATGIIAGTALAATVGLAVKAAHKPKNKMQKNVTRTLNTISTVTHSLANMLG